MGTDERSVATGVQPVRCSRTPDPCPVKTNNNNNYNNYKKLSQWHSN
jgi:hypothetical protein